MLFHFTPHFLIFWNANFDPFWSLFDPFWSFWDHQNYISFTHKSKNKSQHTPDISCYASYSIYIDIYSDFVPFHPALPYHLFSKIHKELAKKWMLVQEIDPTRMILTHSEVFRSPLSTINRPLKLAL